MKITTIIPFLFLISIPIFRVYPDSPDPAEIERRATLAEYSLYEVDGKNITLRLFESTLKPYSGSLLVTADNGITTLHRYLGSYRYNIDLQLLYIFHITAGQTKTGFLHTWLDGDTEVEYANVRRDLTKFELNLDLRDLPNLILFLTGRGASPSVFHTITVKNTLFLKDSLFADFSSAFTAGIPVLRAFGFSYNRVYDIWGGDILFEPLPHSLFNLLSLEARMVSVPPNFHTA